MKVYLFSDSFAERIGGMEIHQQAFLKHYPDVTLLIRDDGISLYKHRKLCKHFEDLEAFAVYMREYIEHRSIFFFNNLSWLTDIGFLKQNFKDAIFIMRSGGNDIYKALDKLTILTLEEKLRITSETINRFIDKLIINSDYSYFRNIEAGISPNKMIKIRGGVDCSIAKENMGQKFEFRRKLEQKYDIRGKKLLVIAARFVPFKGIKEFIVCLASAEICSRCHLLLLGDGIQREQILVLLENSNLSYTYLGKRSNAETMRFIAAADVFVNPTLEYAEDCCGGSFMHTETMGRGMMEAIMQGTPVIALRAGGTAELFHENSLIGYLAEDHSEMMLCLKKAIERPYLVLSETDYSWDEVFRKYDLLFAFLTGKAKASALLAFDYDGTMKTDLSSDAKLSDLMHSNENYAYICLTARSAEEALPLKKQLPVQYLVYENGARIVSQDGFSVFWNQLADEEKQKGDIERLISGLKGAVPFKQTHPFTIHINKEDLSEQNRAEISRIIRRTPFQIIESDKFIKIQHSIFNKKGALDYIFKDHCYSYTIGAGDGLNDAAFILSCDRKYMHTELMKSISYNGTEVIPFSGKESGAVLLKRIIDDCERHKNNEDQ